MLAMSKQRSAEKMVRLRSIAAKVAVLALLFSFSSEEAFAQGFIRKKSDLPDASRFYMARQQITITDESPIINRRSGDGGGSAGGGGASGPRPLSKAGWQPYSQMIPGLKTSLPKVNNGVPVKEPIAIPRVPKGRTSGLNAVAQKAKPAYPSSNPNAVSAYTPYNGYGGSAPGAGYDQANMQSRTNVRGSVLHWARSRRNH